MQPGSTMSHLKLIQSHTGRHYLSASKQQWFEIDFKYIVFIIKTVTTTGMYRGKNYRMYEYMYKRNEQCLILINILLDIM